MPAFRVLALAGLAVLFAAAPASAKMVSFTSTMTAAEEVPNKGPEGASGTAKFDINTDTNQVCYKLTTTGLTESPNKGHIHQGAKGVAGDVVVDLDIAAKGLENCVTGDAAKVAAVVADPAGHYVNLHTASYPAGAVRGQLSATSTPAPSDGQLPRTGALIGLLAALGLGLTGLGTAARAVARSR
jgi:hypothetical protein